MSDYRPRILIADDDLDTRIVLSDYLARHGYEVLVACDGEQAWSLATTNRVDLAVLDVVMPVLSGTELLVRMKALYPAIEVILLTAYGTIAQAVEAMRHGASDYLPKPFRPKQVLGVVQKVWGARQARGQIQVGKWLVDLQTGRAICKRETASLTPLECDLLVCLFQHWGQVVDRETLCREVWGCTAGVENNAIWTAVYRLKCKIGPGYVVTIRGKGYLLTLPGSEKESGER